MESRHVHTRIVEVVDVDCLDVRVWYVAFPFGPATAGRVEVASIAGNERRIEGKVTCLIAEMSIQREECAAG